jgi:hypothetical protein
MTIIEPYMIRLGERTDICKIIEQLEKNNSLTRGFI